jgi:hypothetical protein
MTSMPRSFSVFYFFAGLVVGLLVGVSINKESSAIVSRLLVSGIIVVVAIFWRRIESIAHKRYVETWPVQRARGKWHFILTHYVLIRGSALVAAVVVPALPSLILTKETFLIIGGSLAVVALLLMYLGHESWTECEQAYEVQILRQAAEQSRISAN